MNRSPSTRIPQPPPPPPRANLGRLVVYLFCPSISHTSLPFSSPRGTVLHLLLLPSLVPSMAIGPNGACLAIYASNFLSHLAWVTRLSTRTHRDLGGGEMRLWSAVYPPGCGGRERCSTPPPLTQFLTHRRPPSPTTTSVLTCSPSLHISRPKKVHS